MRVLPDDLARQTTPAAAAAGIGLAAAGRGRTAADGGAGGGPAARGQDSSQAFMRSVILSLCLLQNGLSTSTAPFWLAG